MCVYLLFHHVSAAICQLFLTDMLYYVMLCLFDVESCAFCNKTAHLPYCITCDAIF